MHLSLAKEQLGMSINNTATQNMSSTEPSVQMESETPTTQTQPSESQGSNLDRGSDVESFIPPSGSKSPAPPTESESGYDLTVRVTDHPFGTSQVEIDITTVNGYTDYTKISTGVSGVPSHTFSIPPNQGQTVRVCVDAGILHFEKCSTFATYERDTVASISAR